MGPSLVARLASHGVVVKHDRGVGSEGHFFGFGAVTEGLGNTLGNRPCAVIKTGHLGCVSVVAVGTGRDACVALVDLIRAVEGHNGVSGRRTGLDTHFVRPVAEVITGNLDVNRKQDNKCK